MSEIKKARTPNQKRSILRKEKILETTYKLFSEKGYFNTTTNEIAKEAKVPVSSLYSYFKDKDDILFALLEIYNTAFLNKFDFVEFLQKKITTDDEIEKIIRTVLNILIKAHIETKDFNKELKALYYYKPEVTRLIDQQENKIRSICLELFDSAKDIVNITDLEVASIICVDLISSTVDAIVFDKTQLDSCRIIDGCVEAIMKYIQQPKKQAIE